MLCRCGVDVAVVNVSRELLGSSSEERFRVASERNESMNDRTNEQTKHQTNRQTSKQAIFFPLGNDLIPALTASGWKPIFQHRFSLAMQQFRRETWRVQSNLLRARDLYSKSACKLLSTLLVDSGRCKKRHHRIGRFRHSAHGDSGPHACS